MSSTTEGESFAILASALQPWLDRLVIVGGWAHRLYRLHPHAQELDYAPLFTLDADVAVPAELPIQEPDIRGRLVGHGFTSDFVGTDRPQATHYRLGSEAGGFYVEFLSPLMGSGYDRRGNRKATKEIAGVISQQLRHIELLLKHPWTVEFEAGGSHSTIQIANPVSFLAQKLLIHRKRQREDRAKDILYIHDTLELFGARLPELRELWLNSVKQELHPRSAVGVSEAAHALFGKLTDDVRRAAEIATGRGLSPEDIRAACHYGLTQVFA